MNRAPDILWIVTTQWRASACGYAGDVNARTPSLDALAARSVNYAQAVTPHPFGPFARAALLTGVPSPENGVKDYFDALPASAPTIARELAEELAERLRADRFPLRLPLLPLAARPALMPLEA